MQPGQNLNSIHSDVLYCPIPKTELEKQGLIKETISRAKNAFSLASYQDAELLFTRAISISPEEIYYSNRALTRLKLNRLTAAKDDANKIIEINPDWAKGYFRRGQVDENLGDYQSAINYYQIAVAKEKTNKTIKLIEEKIDNIKRINNAKVSSKKQEPTRIKLEPTRIKLEPTRIKLEPTNNENVNVTKINNEKDKPTNLRNILKKDSGVDCNDNNNDSDSDIDNEVSDVDIYLNMRGYRIKEDGSKTTFFNHNLSDEEKRLIGDITPKRLE